MLIDNETLFVDGAFGDTIKVVDTGVLNGQRNPNPGPGEPVTCFFTTKADLTGATGFEVLSDDVNPPTTVVQSHPVPAAGDTFEFQLPSPCGRYVTIALAGAPSAGEMASGIVMDAQTNK